MKHRCTIEHVFYAAAFLVALGLRLSNLGTLPLSDFEAHWALPALNLAQGKAVELGSQPFYEIWTSVLFFILGHSEFVARFIPALMGSTLVFVPFFLRRGLGQKAALVSAFGLAIDPGLVAAAHYAGSPIVALSALALALALWYDDHARAAVCMAALAALSGSAFFFGVATLVIGLMLSRLMRLWNRQDITPFTSNLRESPDPAKSSQGLLLAAAITILVGGTLFFRYPQGLAAFARSFADFLQSWIVPSGTPLLNMVWMVPFFQPLALLLGTMGFVRAWFSGDRLDRMLGIWALSAWVLCILHLGRQNLDLIWVLTPLWLLSGREIVRFWDVEREEVIPTLGHTFLLFILFSLGWLNLAGLVIPQAGVEIIRMRWILILGVVILSLLATILISFGWSIHIAKRGFANGIVLCLLLFVLSSTTAIAKKNPLWEGAPYVFYPPLAQWSPGAITVQSGLLMDTIGHLAEWHTGNAEIVDVAIVTRDPICQNCLPSAALQWALRDISQVRILDSLPAGETPSIVITPYEEQELKLADSYRGQSFAWQAQPAWPDGYPIGWLRWILYRHMTAHTENIILWARTDVFPGGEPAAVKGSVSESLMDLLPHEVAPDGGNE